MWEGYFAFGGREIGNSARAVGYQRTAECPILWVDDPEDYSYVSDALMHPTYEHSNIESAPWFDPDNAELSSRILGLYILDMNGLDGSTREAQFTEKVGGGGKAGRTRHASRVVRIRAVLTARGKDALEAGMTWLETALSARSCGLHGDTCGLADFEFFTMPPTPRGTVWELGPGGFGDGPFGIGIFGEGPSFGPPMEVPESDEEYLERISRLRRFLHAVKCVRGPVPVEDLTSMDGQHVGHVVEFTLQSEVPYVYTLPRAVVIPPTTPAVVQDVPFNLAPYPSAERTTNAPVLVAQNLCTNPSLEVDGTGWSASPATVSGSAPTSFFTSGRVTGELSAAGVAAYRARILGDGATVASGVATMTIQHDVLLSSLPSGSRVSATLWAAAVSVAGGTGISINTLSASMQFRSSSAAVGGAVSMGSTTSAAEFGGKVFSAKSPAIPAGADRVRITATVQVNWSSNSVGAQNADLRLYADALAVTNP